MPTTQDSFNLERKLDAGERRDEILLVLLRVERISMKELATMFGVKRKAIIVDIDFLMPDYPLEVRRGNRGGVGFSKSYKPERHYFTKEEVAIIEKAICLVTPICKEIAKGLQQLLDFFTPTEQNDAI